MKLKYCQTPVYFAGVLLLALAASLPARADYQSTVLSQSPVGYWRLNETVQPQVISGAVNSGSLGASALGAYVGFPTRQLAGPFAGSTAVGFDGASQYLSTPWQEALNPTASFSVELWANPSEVPKFAYLASSVLFATARSGWYLAQDDGSTFGYGSAFVVRLFNTNAATQSITLWAPVPTASTWYHLVLTYDGTTASLYTNGVLAMSGNPTKNAVGLGYVGNAGAPFTVGARSTLNFFWPGRTAEIAMYGTAISATRVSTHYTTAMTSPANYSSAVNSDSPLVYYRMQEPADPPAANMGTSGSAANGLFIYPAQAAVAAPTAPTYPGFESANKAAGFNGSGGVVQLPALNLNANTVTISGWVKATGSQPTGAGLVLCNGGTTYSGLTIDQIYGGYGLGYIWDGKNYGISPSMDDWHLPPLPDSEWAFVALVVEPSQASLFICDAKNYLNFAGMTNSYEVNHLVEPFDGATLIGAEAGSTAKNFTGSIDEVAIFDRALSAGDLYTQYASAVGSVPPRIFADLQGPLDQVAAGDPVVFTIDAGGTPPLSFAWRKDGAAVATTTSGVLTIANSSLGDSGTYEVTVSNGSGSVLSQSASVTVVTPSVPAITQLQGFANRKLYPGATLRMSISATGGGLQYQWFKDTSLIASATTSSYQIPSVTSADAGTYSVKATNGLGSVTAEVTVTIPNPASGSYEALMVAATPEAWWRMDEAAGSTILFDGMGRHDGYYTNLNGTAPPVTLGAAGAIAGDPSTAASFSPTQKGVGVIPFSSALAPNKFSMEAWVKTTVLNGDLVPVSNTDGTGGTWWQTTGGNWAGYGPGGYAPLIDYNPAVVIASGQWTHLVVNYDSTRVIDGTTYPYVYYVNGQTDGYVWTGSSANTGGPIIIGGRHVPATFADLFFDGQVDEVAIYGRNLLPTEIQDHFQGRFGTSTAPYFIGGFIPQTVTTGKTLSYTTIVQGSVPITLQWYKGSAPIAGATTASLTISDAEVSDSGTYTLWATNSAGTSSQSVSVTVIEPVGYANVTNDLVLHLRFDGNATDSSGRGNNGTPTGSPGFVTGVIGSQALEYITVTAGDPAYVSSASYVDLGKPTDLQFGSTASFSIGLWVKLASGFDGGDLPFIGISTNSMNNPGWALGPTYGGGGWQWCLNDGVHNIDVNGASGSINDGAWHNFVLTVDRTAKVASTYLDGVCVNKTDITSLGSVDNNNYWPVTIGQDPTGVYPEAGTNIVDDLGIWKRALTALEVAQIASAGSTAGRSFDTVNPNPDVIVTIGKSGSNLTLSWSQGELQQSDTLGATATWTAVPGAVAPSYTVTPGTGNKFYRVRVSP